MIWVSIVKPSILTLIKIVCFGIPQAKSIRVMVNSLMIGSIHSSRICLHGRLLQYNPGNTRRLKCHVFDRTSIYIKVKWNWPNVNWYSN